MSLERNCWFSEGRSVASATGGNDDSARKDVEEIRREGRAMEDHRAQYTDSLRHQLRVMKKALVQIQSGVRLTPWITFAHAAPITACITSPARHPPPTTLLLLLLPLLLLPFM